jgi:D-hexose-6-phosphate mutarotase
MDTTLNLDSLKHHEISGAVAISAGSGGLPRLTVTTPRSTAEIYLHGAQVTGFQKTGEPPLLFLSAASQFAADKAIRGGVPICFPWFGSRAGAPAHGFARLTDWHLAATSAAPDGRVNVRLRLPEKAAGPGAFPGKVEYLVTVGDTLTLELHVTNHSDGPLVFEDCLHAYFTVGDIAAVAVGGLKGLSYLDKVGEPKQKVETAKVIHFNSEVDRVYLDAPQAVKIEDAKLKRILLVEKTGSHSTVVWNPWVDKAKAMADFGNEEYRRMVCVEAGNVGPNQITLAPGATSVLKVGLSSQMAK